MKSGTPVFRLVRWFLKDMGVFFLCAVLGTALLARWEFSMEKARFFLPATIVLANFGLVLAVFAVRYRQIDTIGFMRTLPLTRRELTSGALLADLLWIALFIILVVSGNTGSAVRASLAGLLGWTALWTLYCSRSRSQWATAIGAAGSTLAIPIAVVRGGVGLAFAAPCLALAAVGVWLVERLRNDDIGRAATPDTQVPFTIPVARFRRSLLGLAGSDARFLTVLIGVPLFLLFTIWRGFSWYGKEMSFIFFYFIPMYAASLGRSMSTPTLEFFIHKPLTRLRLLVLCFGLGMALSVAVPVVSLVHAAKTDASFFDAGIRTEAGRWLRHWPQDDRSWEERYRTALRHKIHEAQWPTDALAPNPDPGTGVGQPRLIPGPALIRAIRSAIIERGVNNIAICALVFGCFFVIAACGRLGWPVVPQKSLIPVNIYLVGAGTVLLVTVRELESSLVPPWWIFMAFAIAGTMVCFKSLLHREVT